MFANSKLLAVSMTCLAIISMNAFADNAQSNNKFLPNVQVKDQQWNLKNVNGTDSSQAATYVAPNDHSNNPSTKIIIQRIALSVDKGLLPAAVAESENSQMTRTGHKSSVLIIETRPTEAIADLHMELKPGQPREDIQRIIFNPEHTVTIIMHYGMNGEMDSAMRNDMIKVLKDITPPL